MNGIEIEVLHKMRSAVKAKLNELKTGYVGSDALPEYVMILLVAKKSRGQMEAALKRFLGKNTPTFVTWLLDVISKLQDVTVPAEKRKASGESSISTITDLIREGLIQKVKLDLRIASAVKTEVITIEDGAEEDHSDERDKVKKQLEDLQKKIDKAKKKLLVDAGENGENGESSEAVSKRKSKERSKTKDLTEEKSRTKDKSKETQKKDRKDKKKEKRTEKRPTPVDRRPAHEKPSRERDKTPPRRHRTPQRRSETPRRTPEVSITRKIIEKYEKEKKRKKTKKKPKEEPKQRVIKLSEIRRAERDIAKPPRINGRPPKFRRKLSPERRERNRTKDGRKKLESVVLPPSPPSHTPPLLVTSPRVPSPQTPEPLRDKLVIEVPNDIPNDVIDIECDEVISIVDEPPVKSVKPPVETKFIVTISGVVPKRTSTSPSPTPTLEPPKRSRISPIRFETTQKKSTTTIRLEPTHKFDQLPPLAVTAAAKPKVAAIKERCKFFPSCRSPNCEFHHPSIACIAFPACTFGDKCLYLHPLCKFDTVCQRVGCNFMHSAKPKVVVMVPAVPQICKFYPNCVNSACVFHHPRPCKFGKFCMNKKDCAFYHNEVPTKDKLKWVNG